MNFIQRKPKAFALGLSALVLATIGFSARTPVVMAAPKAPAALFAQSALDFDLVNKTGYEIKSVLIGPSSSPNWEADDDVLAGRPFPDDSTLSISFSPKEEAEHWDMKVVYSIDGSSHEWDGLNLTKITKVTLHYDAGANSTSADAE